MARRKKSTTQGPLARAEAQEGLLLEAREELEQLRQFNQKLVAGRAEDEACAAEATRAAAKEAEAAER
eukprot:5455384-Pyramimonas_sp.AAC.1